MNLTRCLPLLGLVCVALVAAGCAGHSVRGVVVEGQTPGIVVVNKDDPRLKHDGLSGAMIELTIDPHTISPKRLATAASDDVGRFEVGVNEPGAGILEYQLSVVTRCAGYQTAVQEMPLPGGNKRLLVVLAPGRDTYHPEADILDETMKAGNEIMKK